MKSAKTLLAKLVLAIAMGAASLAPQGASSQEVPVAAEKNPPGDIPDSQVFVVYKSPLGFSLKAPEGWARKETPDGVSFADRYGQIAVSVTASTTTPTIASVRAKEAADFQNSGRAVKISAISEVKLSTGPAVRIAYTANSDPNPVTNKQIRLEGERYLIGKNGKLAALTFSAPAGADNADQWALMTQSFQWQ